MYFFVRKAPCAGVPLFPALLALGSVKAILRKLRLRSLGRILMRKLWFFFFGRINSRWDWSKHASYSLYK